MAKKATKAELKVENEDLKRRIHSLKTEHNDIERQYQELQQIQRLQQENAKLTAENVQIELLKHQIANFKLQTDRLDDVNKELARKRAKSESMKEGVTVLTDKVWKPLEVLRDKFKEFDVDHSGFIDRREFRRLCAQIESDLKVSRLFSMLDQHSASSVMSNDKPSFGHNTGTIDSTQGWSAAQNDTNQWYQIDAVVPISIGGVLLQGRYNADQWVKTFQISHSIDGVSWTKLTRIFEGNRDRDNKETILFDIAINARYIRFHPVSWHNHISMRADLLWVEGVDDEKVEDFEGPTGSQFTVEEEAKLFGLFDLKQTGLIDSSEFLAVLDREAIRNPRQHPNEVIKETMKHLLYGNINVKEDYKIEMLGKEAKGFKFKEGIKGKCCVCSIADGLYGFTANCQHFACTLCLQKTLTHIMENGEFPAYCIGCKEINEKPALDKLLNGELLRFWVEEKVIDVPFACRMWRAQSRSIQDLQFEECMKTTGMRKCPNEDCAVVILKNEGCNWFKCKQCGTEICYGTGKIAGKGPGMCGGGHNCHY